MNPIPFVSQHWKKCCTKDALRNYSNEFIEKWSHRSCGIACVCMIIRYFDKENTSLVHLFEEAYNCGYYTPKGWAHQGLADMLTKRGYVSRAKAADKEEVIKGLRNGLIYIVSVTYTFPSDGRKGGHLVLAHSIDDENRIYFNDPSTWGENNKTLEESIFFSSYSDRCIEVINAVL